MSRNDEREDFYEENDDATSSDSDQDWLEYQDYLHSHHEKGEHFVPHHEKTVVVPHHEEVVHEEFHPEVGHHYHETVTYGKPVHHEVIPVHHEVIPVHHEVIPIEHHVVPVEHHVFHRHVYDSDTDSDADSEDDYLAHDDYLRYKYDHEHEARSHDALTKQ